MRRMSAKVRKCREVRKIYEEVVVGSPREEADETVDPVSSR